MYNIPRIKQEEVENINILITSNETVSVKNKQKNPTKSRTQIQRLQNFSRLTNDEVAKTEFTSMF